MRTCKRCGTETPLDDLAIAFRGDDRYGLCWTCVDREADARPAVSGTIRRDIEAAAAQAEATATAEQPAEDWPY